MKPLVTFPDPLLATLEILRDRLPAHLDSGVTATYGTADPDVADTGGQPLPYVRVTLDGSFGTYPVRRDATVRVAVWGASVAQGLAVVQIAQGLLLSYEGGPKVRGYGELTGPYNATDPDSGSPFSYITVSARLRPIPL